MNSLRQVVVDASGVSVLSDVPCTREKRVVRVVVVGLPVGRHVQRPRPGQPAEPDGRAARLAVDGLSGFAVAPSSPSEPREPSTREHHRRCELVVAGSGARVQRDRPARVAARGIDVPASSAARTAWRDPSARSEYVSGEARPPATSSLACTRNGRLATARSREMERPVLPVVPHGGRSAASTAGWCPDRQVATRGGVGRPRGDGATRTCALPPASGRYKAMRRV